MQSRSGNHAEGIDVSHWQGTIDWAKVAADGITFSFIKASQGMSSRDSMFAVNVKGARTAGLLIGAYHFLDATSAAGAKQEAANFAAAITAAGGIDLFQLPPVMDYESNPGNLNKSQINAVAEAFLTEVERLTGVKPIIYTGNSFASNFHAALGTYRLWVARYSRQEPYDVATWSKWAFWQYSDGSAGGYRSDGTRAVAGISGGVDLNEYAGTLDELKAEFTKQEADKEMTDAEKAQVKALEDKVAALEKYVNISGNQVPPQWAHPAIAAAKAAGIITTSSDKGHAELVMIQMMYNAGLCNSELVTFFRNFSAETRAAIEKLTGKG